MKEFFYKLSAFFLTFNLIIFLRLYLSFFGFGKLVKLLKQPKRNFLNISKISYVLKSIKIICSVVPRISCLVRASVLKIMFSETKNLIIYIGIRKNEFKEFESHAWVTLEKKVILNDEKIRLYKTIYTI